MAHPKVYTFYSSLSVIEARSTSSNPQNLHIVLQLCFPVGIYSTYNCVREKEKVREKRGEKRW